MTAVRGTADFVRGTLERLRAESPAQYERVRAEVRHAAGRYQVSGERFTLRAAADGSLAVEEGWDAPGTLLEAEVTADAIVRLVDGTTTVERLLADETLVLKGPADAMLALAAALRAFVEGAALSHRQQRWFEEYRKTVQRPVSSNRPAGR